LDMEGLPPPHFASQGSLPNCLQRRSDI
jgi:hypothetical protein